MVINLIAVLAGRIMLHDSNAARSNLDVDSCRGRVRPVFPVDSMFTHVMVF